METLTSIASFIFFASLKSTALLALVLLAQKAFSRYLSAHGRYLLWLAVVISLITPAGFELRLPNVSAIDAFMEGPQEQTPIALQDSSIAHAGAPMFSATPEPYASLRWESALPLLWLTGVLAVLAAMAWSSRRFAALARNARAAPESLQADLSECEHLAGCTAGIRLLASIDLRAPVVAGLLKPVLLWPAGLETRLTPAQLQHVLMHEVMHVKRHDIFSACAVAVLQALHWFNPAIWLAFSWLRQDREMACDATTVRTLHTVDARDYAHTLIELGAMRPVRARFSPALGILDSHAQLRRRIHMLAQAADSSTSARHFFTTALLLAFSTLAFIQPAMASRMFETPATLPTAQLEIEQSAAVSAATAPLTFTATRQATAPLVKPEAKQLRQAPAVQVLAEPVQETVVTPVREQLVFASAGSTDALPAPVLKHSISEQQNIAAPTTAPADKSAALICRRQDTPGSRIQTRRVCLTQKQWVAGGLVPRPSAFSRSLSPTDFLEPLPVPQN